MRSILIATDNLLPRWDGISRFLNELLPILALKYNITVIGPGFLAKPPKIENVRYVTFPVSKVLFGDYHPSFPKLNILKDEILKADLVFTQTLGPIGALTIIEASRQRKPIFSFIHSIEWELYSRATRIKGVIRDSIYGITKLYAKFLYNKATLLFVPSSEIGEFFSIEGIRTQKKVVRLGVNLEKFSPPIHKASAKNEIGIDADRFIVGYCGRIAHEKDLLTLYRGFRRFKKKHPHSMLLLVGDGLKSIKKRFENDPSVKITGPTNETEKYLKAMDIYVLSSLTETSSLSTMEAMACGVPVVCTPVGALKSYVRTGYNGLFFPRKHPVVLAHRLEYLYTHENERTEMGKRARKTALTNFSWQKSAKELEEVFELF